MKALLLHGTDGSPEDAWMPWLKASLEDRGYEVLAPELPNSSTPDRLVYNNYIFGLGFDLNQSLVIGHSSGAVEILNLLDDSRCPVVGKAVMIAPWLTSKGTIMEQQPTKYGPIHGDGRYDFNRIKSKADKIMVIHSDDDPYCPYAQGQEIAELTEAIFVGLQGQEHFSPSTHPGYFQEFPGLIEILESNHII